MKNIYLGEKEVRTSELRSQPARVVHEQARQPVPFTLVLDVKCDDSWQSHNQNHSNQSYPGYVSSQKAPSPVER